MHIAIVPIEAGETLIPGSCVRIEDGKAFGLSGGAHADWDAAIGVVDPFLKKIVNMGERFWLCLYPGTVQGIRHTWSHPGLPVTDRMEKEEDRVGEASGWLATYAKKELGCTLDVFLAALHKKVDKDEATEKENFPQLDEWDDMPEQGMVWVNFYKLTGKHGSGNIHACCY